MEVWGQVSAGKGPDECCWVVCQIAENIKKEAESQNLSYHVIYEEFGKENTRKSIWFSLVGNDFSDFMASWTGSIKWIGESPFRPNHKRKNWFAGVAFYEPVSETMWDTKSLQIENFRGSGPGGQHRNKVETGVRITHIPTGIIVTACEERSQMQNKKLALAKLAYHIESLNQSSSQQNKNNMWQQHQNLERGNAIRTYKGKKFILEEFSH